MVKVCSSTTVPVQIFVLQRHCYGPCISTWQSRGDHAADEYAGSPAMHALRLTCGMPTMDPPGRWSHAACFTECRCVRDTLRRTQTGGAFLTFDANQGVPSQPGKINEVCGMAKCTSFHHAINPAKASATVYTQTLTCTVATRARRRKSKSREDDYVCFGRREFYSKREDKSVCTRRLLQINRQPLQHGAQHPQRKHTRPGTAFAVLQQNHGTHARTLTS